MTFKKAVEVEKALCAKKLQIYESNLRNGKKVKLLKLVVHAQN